MAQVMDREKCIQFFLIFRFAFALSHISQTGSVYITVSVTIERYLAVCHPRRSKQMCNSGGAAWTILGVTTFAVLFNATKFFELEVTTLTFFLLIAPLQLVRPGFTRLFVKRWGFERGISVQFRFFLVLLVSIRFDLQVYALWLTNIVMVFLPFITLLVLNAYIAYTIRKSLEKFDNHQQKLPDRSELKEKSREATLVLVIIVCIFLICNFWGFVLTLLERIVDHETLMVEHHTFYTFSREAINFLAIINSSINFVIYIVFGKEFRYEPIHRCLDFFGATVLDKQYFRKELVVVYGCGMRGITMRLPVHDKFTIWRTWGKRAKSISISGRSNLSAHVLSSASNLDIPTLEHLEQTRFLQEPSHDKNGNQHDKNGNHTQTKLSPARIMQNGSGKIPKRLVSMHGLEVRESDFKSSNL
ncbi:hypothetical protein ANCCAN_07345 [Ancylostoma caninum]|uniref:G-protein coupled receptors family 1 profile domain-containing protein n=1 Tax=Ancylostoma caninum TaxID=29170 RepID=A0A368GTI5_ANCCA|nr:hypothetical protein ANCCAN_07345 [Ancylostoma caninum]